jgi:hypothetical protein
MERLRLGPRSKVMLLLRMSWGFRDIDGSVSPQSPGVCWNNDVDSSLNVQQIPGH